MHWTYAEVKGEQDLAQGDILEPTEKLQCLFAQIHPHFTDEKYRDFIVLTQTCDLVRRSAMCKATHICLSVVRSIKDVMQSGSLKDRFGYLGRGVFDKRRRSQIEQLIERIINQNENALGLFYLHKDLDSGISVPSVALLRVSVSFRAREHYETLLSTRVGRLSPEFQSKLGWIVGNLYSRVGVKDWEEDPERAKQLIVEILGCGRDEPSWVDRKAYIKATKQYADIDGLPVDELRRRVLQFTPQSPFDKSIDVVMAAIVDAFPSTPKDRIDAIKRRLLNDVKLKEYMRKFSGDEE